MGLRHAAMLEVNEFLVLDFVREQATTTRPEIGRALGLSDSSVSRIVGRLMRSGLVIESPGAATAAGRPRSVITFNHRAGAVIGVDLGGTRCHGALADLSGETIAQDVRPTRADGGAFAALSATIDRLRGEASQRGLPVEALAVGIPAIVDPETGAALGGPNVDWQGFELVARLAEHVGVPFLVENDANLAALAHAWRGEGVGVSHFVTLTIGTGIGAAVVADGRLVKGRHNAAGEVGYLLMSREQLRQEAGIHAAQGPDGRPDGLGAFERLAAGSAIVRQASAALAEAAEPSALSAGPVTPERIFAEAAAGDRLAAAVIDELVDNVALAVGAIAVTVDPELVILEGGVGRSLEPYLDELARRLEPHLLYLPRLCVGRLGADATVLGGVAAALQLARRQAAPTALFGAFTVSGRLSGEA